MRILNNLKRAITKYGVGPVVTFVTLDGYRRVLLNEEQQAKLNILEKELESKEVIIDKVSPDNNEILESDRRYYRTNMEKEKATAEYNANPTEINEIKKKEMEAAHPDSLEKLVSLKEISKSDIGGIFINAYNQYVNYLDSLTPDKIVCLFNILIGSMTLSSFNTVLSIMLSENLINRIRFLDKYPRILKLLRLRNNINRKISKFYLLTHVVVILGGLIGNIYMFSL